MKPCSAKLFSFIYYFCFLFRNGIKYAGEIHFVYQNRLTSQTTVIGIFMQSDLDSRKVRQAEAKKTRQEWQRYFDIVRTLTSRDDSILFDLNLKSLIGDNLMDFWRYEGSLTTPPCTEGIIWTLLRQPITFAEEQIKILRENVHFQDYRGPQPLYKRKVYRSFVNETLSLIPDYNLCLPEFQNEATKDKILMFGVISCSTYSFFFLLLALYSVLIFILFASCKGRYSKWKKV